MVLLSTLSLIYDKVHIRYESLDSVLYFFDPYAFRLWKLLEYFDKSNSEIGLRLTMYVLSCHPVVLPRLPDISFGYMTAETFSPCFRDGF
jgi:hypothetical protein